MSFLGYILLIVLLGFINGVILCALDSYINESKVLNFIVYHLWIRWKEK